MRRPWRPCTRPRRSIPSSPSLSPNGGPAVWKKWRRPRKWWRMGSLPPFRRPCSL